MIKFPTLEEAIELHKRLIARFGGSAGVRDLGLLESALFRPQTGYYEDLPHMAAALMESLLINHPCVDGNKRLAFFLTDVFLRMNGSKLVVAPAEGEKFILGYVADPQRDLNNLRAWAHAHSKKI